LSKIAVPIAFLKVYLLLLKKRTEVECKRIIDGACKYLRIFKAFMPGTSNVSKGEGSGSI
jgi:hypothetical protein